MDRNIIEEEKDDFRCHVIITWWEKNEYVYVFRSPLNNGGSYKDFYGEGLIWGKENLEKVLYEVVQEACNQIVDILYKDGKKKYTAQFNLDVHGLGDEKTEEWTKVIEHLELAARAGKFSKPNGKGKLVDALSRVDKVWFTDDPIEKSSYVGRHSETVCRQIDNELRRHGINSLSKLQEIRQRTLDENQKYLDNFDFYDL